MPACMPVTWNIGSADEHHAALLRAAPVAGRRTVVACTLACVCMQPFGLPVVPEV